MTSHADYASVSILLEELCQDLLVEDESGIAWISCTNVSMRSNANGPAMPGMHIFQGTHVTRRHDLPTSYVVAGH